MSNPKYRSVMGLDDSEINAHEREIAETNQVAGLEQVAGIAAVKGLNGQIEKTLPDNDSDDELSYGALGL